MRTIFTAAAVAAALTSTIGMASPRQSFTHEGRTYTYTTVDAGNGRKVIQGRALPGNQAFRLVVRGTRVTGTVGNVPVGFKVAEARNASAGSLVLASR